MDFKWTGFQIDFPVDFMFENQSFDKLYIIKTDQKMVIKHHHKLVHH